MPQNELHLDPAWLEGYRRGQPDALARVYERYAPDVTARITRGFNASKQQGSARIRVADPDERDDVLQELFLRAFSDKVRASYDGSRPFLPYLDRICRNIVIDRHRRSQREAATFVSEFATGANDEPLSRVETAADEDASPHSIGQSPEGRTARTQLSEALLSFVRALEPEEFELLRLYYEDDATQREAARRMGIDRNDVRKLIANLRIKVLRHMRDIGAIRSMSPDELLALASLVLSSLGGQP